MRPLRIACAITLLVLTAACGGRAVDLDRPANPESGGAPGGSIDPMLDRSQKTIVSESLYLFWVDEQRLYWSALVEQPLRSCLKADCARTTIKYGKVWGYSLAIGANDIYWIPDASPTSVVTCPKSGCGTAPRTLFQDPPRVSTGIAGDGDYLYWASVFDIYRCANAGCASTPEVVAADEQTGRLVVGADHVYWQRLNEASSDDTRLVVRAPKAGTEAPQTILSLSGFGEYTDVDFALGAENIYWVDPSGHVLSCPLAGCGNSAPTELVTTNQPKQALHVDDSGLYWVETDFGFRSMLHFCGFDQCPSNESMLVVDKPIQQFEIDTDFVYWTQGSDDGSYPTRIQRIAKPRAAR